MACMGTNIDNRCPDGKFIRISPKIEGRIVNLGQPIIHDD